LIKSGIAIIELCLVDNDGTENVISVNGKREQISFGVSKRDILLQRANEDAACFKLAVNITTTTVDIEVLHKVCRFASHGSSNHTILLMKISGSSSR
jgi:hypothetical protein